MIETINFMGQTISIYYMFWFLAMIVTYAIGLMVRKEYGFTVAKSIIYISLSLCIALLLAGLTSWIFGEGRWQGINYVRVVYWFWLYFLVLAYFLKDTWWKVMDFLTLPVGWFYVIGHTGCLFPGCCHGYPSPWGIYSNAAECICFPVQIIEILINLIINFILLRMRKKPHLQGLLNPWYMVMFGSTRFVTEFFRDNKKLFWGISEMAIHALVAFALGSVMLIIFYRKKEKHAQ